MKSTKSKASFIFPIAITLLLLIGAIVLVPAVIEMLTPYPDGKLLPAVIDRDFELKTYSRVQPSGFWLEGNEKLVIRDCIVYASAGSIYVTDFANLTMINVRVVPSVFIQVSRNASLRMVNVTNWSTGWYSHGSENQPGLFSLVYFGGIIAYDNSRVWIENSRIAGVRKDFYASGANITVKDSWIAGSRPIGPDFLGNVALKVNSTISKTEFKWGEPLSMTFRLENVGNETLSFFSNGTDRFVIVAYEYRPVDKSNVTFYNNWDDPHYTEPIPPQYRFPSQLEPGKAFVQTLTWKNPPLRPGRYHLEGQIYSKPLELWVGCGGDVVTISEEKWQG